MLEAAPDPRYKCGQIDTGSGLDQVQRPQTSRELQMSSLSELPLSAEPNEAMAMQTDAPSADTGSPPSV